MSVHRLPSDSAQNTSEAGAWTLFIEAEDTQTFCQSWLAVQCRQLEGVRAGLVLIEDKPSVFIPAAIWPSPQVDVAYLGDVAQECLSTRQGVLRKGEGAAANSRMIAYPIEVEGTLYAVVVLDVVSESGSEIQATMRRLHWGCGWLEAHFWQLREGRSEASVARAQTTLDIVALTGEHTRFEDCAMALCNELAEQLSCDRVALGIEKRGRVHLKALSHSAWFERKSEFVTQLENAMDEAIDQRRTVVHPPISEQHTAISVAHRDFSSEDPVCSVVIKVREMPFGVMTFVRKNGFDAELIAQLEAIAALVGPIIHSKVTLRRWFAGRLVDKLADFRRSLFNPRTPSFALGVIAFLCLIGFLVFAEGEYRVSAQAMIGGKVQRAIVAPFSGYIATANVRAGQTVSQGDILATLDDRDLRLEARKWLSSYEQADRKYREALSKHERASSRILAAELAEAQAQLKLVEEKLARTKLTAPFDGVIVTGDLSQMLGSPVEQGKVLFEVAPLNAYRVILKVDEHDIRDVTTGQEGKLVLAGLTNQSIPFRVQNIAVASAEDGQNVFRVEAQLDKADTRLRPGMEGVGKIEIGERKLFWVWTRSFANWVTLKLWTWTP